MIKDRVRFCFGLWFMVLGSCIAVAEHVRESPEAFFGLAVGGAGLLVMIFSIENKS